jgi:leucyl aminopeptidase
VQSAVKAARFEGGVGEIVELLAPAGLSHGRLLLVGTGPTDKIDAGVAERIGGAIAARLLLSGETTVSVDVAGVLDGDLAANLAHGAVLRSWRFDQYRTTQKDKQKPTLTSLAIVGAGEVTAHDRLMAIAGGVARTRTLVTLPPNVLYPESFVESARDLAALGVELTILDDADMKKLGMGALLGVAQGSVRPARILAMRWNGTGRDDVKPVCLVGKGVTFDTGGISLKPPAGMEDMKWDMAGSAAVIGAIEALASRHAKVNAIGAVGLVENMPGHNAQRPSDIVRSLSGKTIEVLNTDAEGRLVLADVLWYVQDRFKPKAMFDLATLTGAVIVALGHEYAGIMGNDAGLAEKLAAAGEATGEKVWRLPLGEAYDRDIDSPAADVKNIAAGRGAGSIIGGQFLARFVNDVPWVHIGIAGVAWSGKDTATCPKGATAFGVRLLDRLVADNYEEA